MNKDKYKIIDVYPSCVQSHRIIIEWCEKAGINFGSITIEIHDDGVFIDSEYKSREFVKDILSKLVDMAEFTCEEGEEKQTYNGPQSNLMDILMTKVEQHGEIDPVNQVYLARACLSVENEYTLVKKVESTNSTFTPERR